MSLFHKHTWKTINTLTSNLMFKTEASQVCTGCSKVRGKKYKGLFSPEDLNR